MSTDVSNNASPQSLTLWVWPSGLFPRRMMYFLKAKALNGSITPSTLATILKIVPVALTMEPFALDPLPGHEPRPANTSLPALRISHPNNKDPSAEDQYIYQSTSILNYLETIFPSPQSHSFLGNDPIHAGHVADIVQQINESLPWMNVYIRHSQQSSLVWSGMTAADQSSAVAADALKNWKMSTRRLESWVKRDLERGSVYVASSGGDGSSGPTIADFILIATHDYMEEMYGFDCFEGCELLKDWVCRVKGTSTGMTSSGVSVGKEEEGGKENKTSGPVDWYLSKEQLQKIEKEGSFEDLFEG